MKTLRILRASLVLAGAPSAHAASPVDDFASGLRALLDDRDRLAVLAASAGDAEDLKAQIRERDGRIEVLLKRLAELSPPPELNLAVALSLGDVVVGPGQSLAQVPVTLSEPTNHTIAIRWQAQNGAGTNQGTHYRASGGWLVFHPGESTKLAEVPLLKSLGAGQTIRLVVASTPNNPPLKQTKGVGTITGGGPASPAVAADAIALPAQPVTKALSWSVDFADPAFCVTDSGKGADGAPCWQGRPMHGLMQESNRELGLYASPDRFPSVTMTGVGPDGKRFIQLERHPEGFAENGKPILRPWDQKPFVYSSGMIQAAKFPAVIRSGSYVEARLRVDLVEGTWPAFWLLPADGTWPPEIDIFEGFWRKGSVASDVLTMSQHWRKQNGSPGTYGTDVPLAQAVPGFDVRDWHVYGVHIEDEWLTYYVDDRPVWRAPNAARRGVAWYPLFDVTTGGLVGEPPADAALPAKMGLDWLKVWN